MKTLLLVLAALTLSCGGLGGPGLKSSGGGGTTITDTLTLTATAATNIITSSSTDATTTSSVAALTIKPVNDIGSSDLLVAVRSSADASAFTVTENGVASAAAYRGMSGANLILYTGTATPALTAVVGGGGYYYGNDGNDASAEAHNFGNATALTTAGASIARFYHDDHSTLQSRVTNTGFYVQPVQTVTVADDANGGTAPASTVTPSSNIIKLAYNDPQSASVGTFSETGAQEGTTVNVVHTGSGGTVVFSDSAGVQELGAVPCTVAAGDNLSVVYLNSSWHKLNCNDN